MILFAPTHAAIWKQLRKLFLRQNGFTQQTKEFLCTKTHFQKRIDNTYRKYTCCVLMSTHVRSEHKITQFNSKLPLWYICFESLLQASSQTLAIFWRCFFRTWIPLLKLVAFSFSSRAKIYQRIGRCCLFHANAFHLYISLALDKKVRSTIWNA